ncbi:TetR/AcrR family transcriptional regulator [Saccharopolyspora sp. 5N708]|uniref:TetR/AcrR family transcriptional regulator n=1 Tax=Saccharopolyspora sp. 5N708 TaxID=3457424 RepID=UPI003FD3E9E6
MTSAPETRQRRRGQALETAIYDAVLAELAAVGYGRLTMEGVAARARTAKSSLYRRWNSLEDLVIAAVHHELPDVATVAETGDVREELLAALTLIADTLTGPIGPAVTSILGGMNQSPNLQAAARERIVAPRVRALQTVFERAAARGEIRAGAATPFVVQTGPAIVIHTCLVRGLELSTQDIEDIVDQVILPAVRPAS